MGHATRGLLELPDMSNGKQLFKLTLISCLTETLQVEKSQDNAEVTWQSERKKLTVFVVIEVAVATFSFTASAFARRFLRSLSDGCADRSSSGFYRTGPPPSRMLLGDATRQLFGTPAAGNASGSRRAVIIQLVSTVAFVHDLSIVGHLLHVWPVVVIALCDP